MKGISSKLFYTLGVALLCGNLHAQSLAEAKKLYEEGKYAEAKPAFERLVKQAPNNSSYNQWYGVCCYETGDLVGAEKHLAKAVKRKVQESYRYMAEVYYQTYRFDQAVEMLEEYIAILNKKKKDPQAFEARLEEAENAQRMVEKAEDVQIIDSLVVDKADFLSAYTLSEESGTLATYQDFFQTPDTVRSTVYENQKGDKIYYAKPAEDGHYYLFTQSLLMDKWGDEKRLPIIILEPGKAYRREDGSVGQNFYAKEVYDISQTTARDQVQPQVRYDDRLLLKGLIASSPVPIRAVEELPQGRGAMFSAEQNAILVKKGMDAPDIFRCVSLEVANVQLAQSMDGYSRETDGYKAYAVSYMLCKRYGVDAKEYEISKLDGVFQGQVPREDIPAVLTDMRDTFKSLNGRMARAMGLTRDSKQKEQER